MNPSVGMVAYDAPFMNTNHNLIGGNNIHAQQRT